MADPKIYIRRSATPNKVPTTNQLALGELAINTYDGKLYLEQDQGGVGVGTTIIAVNPWNVGVGSLAYNINFTAGNVGVGTTNPLAVVTSANTSVLAAGIVTAYKFYGDGSLLTGISGGASISTEAPSTPTAGDLWWDSDLGELYIYYNDGNTSQWVETAGGSETVTISDSAPTGANSGDLWWDSDAGVLLIYYDDGAGAQWIDATGAYSSGLLYWQANSTGIHTLGNVGVGTTNARYKLEVGAVGAAGTSLWVNGDARITGILSVGQGTVTIDGSNNEVKVGTGVTIHDTNGVQVGENTLHSSGLTVNNINVTGIITASGGFNLGISSAGTSITSGPVTSLNFIGAGNTFAVNGTTVDISIAGGGGASVTVSDNPPETSSHGDLWYRSDTMDLKVYYDESEVGAGTSAFWVSANGGGGSESYWVQTEVGIHALSNVGIGTTNPTSALNVKGDIGIAQDSLVDLNLRTITTTTSTDSQTVIDTFDKTNYRSAKYHIQMTNDSSYHVVELLLLHNDNTSSIYQYNALALDSVCGIITSAISGDDVQLLITPSSAQNTDIVLSRTLLRNTGSVGIVGDLMASSGTIDLQNESGTFDLNT